MDHNVCVLRVVDSESTYNYCHTCMNFEDVHKVVGYDRHLDVRDVREYKFKIRGSYFLCNRCLLESSYIENEYKL